MATNISTRVQKHRATLRKAGLRPVQIWVPDTRLPGFAAECLRQSQFIQNDIQEQEISAWLENVADREGWQ